MAGQRNRLRGLLVLAFALGAGTAACAARARMYSSPPPAPAARFAVDTVPVVLAAAEGKSQLAVEIGPGRRVTFRRAGASVVASDGRSGARLGVSPTVPEFGLTLGERTYSGELRIEARENGGLRVTNVAPLEDYVAGVVAGELSLWSAVTAELEAQAIVARTVAATTLARRPFLFDTTADQVYHGRFVPSSSRGSRRAAERLADAVAASRGRILVRDGRPFDARFHASCGGTTAALHDVFPESPDRAPGVACQPCARRVAFERGLGHPDPERPLGWSFTASAGDLSRAAEQLGAGPDVALLAPERIDGDGRWIDVRVATSSGSRVVSFRDFRLAVGPTALHSGRILRTWPKPGDRIRNGLFFEGRGRGHGVGLCQEGSRDYAQLGWSAEQIIAHYYPGTSVVRVDPRP